MKPNLIGLCGAIGAGKSTVAEILQETYRYHRIPFADPLKSMLRVLGLTAEQVNGSEKETPCHLLGGHTPRWAMQSLGTEWGRQMIHPDLWIRAWERAREGWPYVLAEDARFNNEFDAIRSAGGVLICVMRPGHGLETKHASEACWRDADPDITIWNDGSIDDLAFQVRDIFRNAFNEAA